MKYGFLAACMMHVEGYYSTKSLAFKNNNPGNIEHNGQYRRYPDKLSGYTALISDITLNAGTPLQHFIAKYAPPTENNTSLYLQIVCELTGMKPNDVL